MTTLNHTLLAAVVAIPTDHVNWPIKAVVLIGLVISHIPADILPHKHFYEESKLKEMIGGALLELTGGLIFLPILIWRWTHINFGWLMACVIAASLIDILIAAGKFSPVIAVKVRGVIKLNHWAHRWEHQGKMDNGEKLRWEFAQGLFLTAIVLVMVFWRYFSS